MGWGGDYGRVHVPLETDPKLMRFEKVVKLAQKAEGGERTSAYRRVAEMLDKAAEDIPTLVAMKTIAGAATLQQVALLGTKTAGPGGRDCLRCVFLDLDLAVCRRNPPLVLPDRPFGSDAWFRPELGTDWCGEFVKIKGDIAPPEAQATP